MLFSTEAVVTEIASAGTRDKRTVTVPAMALWLLIAGYLLAVICFTWNPTPIAQLLAAMGIVGACLHDLWLSAHVGAVRDLHRNDLCH
jgi:hypothetical protein